MTAIEPNPIIYRYAIEVDGYAMCSGPFDDGNADYLRKQMNNYREFSPRSVVRAVISFMAEPDTSPITHDELVQLARGWIEDTSVELVGELIDSDYLSDQQVQSAVEKHFAGGWDAFTAIGGKYG